ncbi:MAG: amino acid carrier protein [Flavobacteriaceae bacterium]|nr:amino acid carrier protein [Flavobacteriaceae bacterium]MCY4267561.1 amino acid carrier protein [Flavobacteriaceae bacterium]
MMLLLVVGGGLYLVIHSRLTPLRRIAKGFKLLLSVDQNQGISRFKVLSAVLAATVGLGNISGVAIAIYMGGPGVLVWMWLTAIVGMVIKFYSCSLSIQLRTKDHQGQWLGGPMYYMDLGIKRYGKPMAIWFSIAGLFGVLPAFTANQMTASIIDVVQPNQYLEFGDFYWKLILGVVFCIISAIVIFGGLKKIVQVTSSLVPTMVGIYFLLGGYILMTNSSQIIPSFGLIFGEAFQFETAVTGGFWGLVLLGIRRAVFSNESGVGNAPMYHGQSQSEKGTDEGLVAMLGPLFDTILVCTITGLVLIISQAYLIDDLNGITLTLEAFRSLFYGFGDELLLLMVLVFGISTLLTYSYYGVKCLGYLIQPKWGHLYNYFYIASIIISSIVTVEIVIGMIDLSFALMCIPNMMAVLYLAHRVRKEMKQRQWLRR